MKDNLEFFQGPFKKLFHDYQLAGAVLEAINEHPYSEINQELTKKLKSYRISTMPFIKNHNTAEGLKTFHKVGEVFGFSWLLRGFDLNKNLSYWQKVFTEGIRLELYDAQGLLTDMIMAHMKEHSKSFDQALETFKEDIELLNQLMTEIKVKHDKDMWSLAVLTRHLRLLTRRLYDR